MKKILMVLLCLIFTSNLLFAQEIFLSLTKYSEPLENLPANVTVITQEEIENKHVNTLGELLENETGVFYKTNGTTGDMPTVFMRGAASSARTLVLIDGRRVNDAGSGGENFAAIPASLIERVEIIRGTGSAIYGTGAFGGVINIITKTAKADAAMADVGFSFGSFQTFNPYAVVQHYGENVSVLVGGDVYKTNGYRDNADYKGSSLLFNASINITENSSLSVSANSYSADFGYPGSAADISDTPGRRNDNNEYVKADYSLNLENSKLNLSAYISNNTSFNYGSWGDSITTNKTAGIQGDLLWQSFLFGAEFWQEYYVSDDVSGGIIAGNPGVDKSRNTSALYAQWSAVFDNFRIIPAIRYDYNSAYGSVFTPSVSAVCRLSDYFKLSANFGKVWRAPTFNDLYSPWGSNPDLDPEEGISGDLGVEYVNNKVRLSAAGYYIQSKDLIVADAMWIPHNTDEARQYGIELEAGYIITSWLSNKLNYTYLETENKSKGFDGKSLAFSPNHSVNYTLTIKPFQKLSVSGVVSYKDKYYENADNTLKNDGFAAFDLNIAYKLNSDCSLWIKGFNLANAKYQIVNGYPMPGATVYAGVNLKFWK